MIQEERVKSHELVIRKFFVLITMVFFVVSTVGCDAFVRKFTRKAKKKEVPVEELVLVPEQYASESVSVADRAKQSFIFWKSWQDELSEALTHEASHKRKVSCVNEAIRNLEDLFSLLNDEKQKALKPVITSLEVLRVDIKNDLSGKSNVSNARTADRIRRKILREIPYSALLKSLQASPDGNTVSK
jgi:hypothetical protein